MFSNMGGMTAIVILVVVLLLFGATKLPALAKSVGQSAKIFKKEMNTDSESKVADEKSTDSTTQQ